MSATTRLQGSPPPLEDTWHFWRGSPELLGQIANVSLRVVRSDETDQAKDLIDFKVDDDHEIFSSVADFLGTASHEALEHFTSIKIQTESDGIAVEVELIRLRPSWQPSFGPDANVRLSVRGPDEASVATAFDAMRGTIRRGKTFRMSRISVV